MENQNSDKPSENEKVVKPTEELALFQLHQYTSFNLACPTDVLLLRFSGEQRQARSAEIREKIAPVLQAKLNELKQRQICGRFDNFLIFSSFFLELRSKGLYPS